MTRKGVLVLAIALILNACIPLNLSGVPTLAPDVNAQATDEALAATMVAQTLNAAPMPTLTPDTETQLPTATETEPLLANDTPTPMTVTNTDIVTSTVTTAVANQVNTTVTETLHPRFFGTQPPALPYGKVRLINKAKADVYVSLQCKTVDGYTTIIEYPVFGRMNISAPAGKYHYVAWVGGRQFLGSFSLSKGEEISITFNKEKITLNK